MNDNSIFNRYDFENKLFGERLLKARKKLGLTQKEIANKAAISYSSYSQYENNKAIPPLNIAFRIARVLNVSIDYICGYEYPIEVNDLADVAQLVMVINNAINGSDTLTSSIVLSYKENEENNVSLVIESKELKKFFLEKMAIESFAFQHSDNDAISRTDLNSMLIKTRLDLLSQISLSSGSVENAET